MKISLILAALIVVTGTARAQYLKIDNGLVISSFNNQENLPYLYSERLHSYSALLGADYLMNNWFYLSSQVGYMVVGGKEVYTLFDAETQSDKVFDTIEKGNYVHLNTTGRVYLHQDPGLSFFIGAGPYMNILVSDKNFASPFLGLGYSGIHWGGKGELGVTIEANRIKIGLVGSYMRSLSSPVKSEFLYLASESYLISITTGYSIR